MKYILLCLAVLVSALPVSAQNPGPIYPTNTIPAGACSQNVGYLYTPTGVLYTCQNGTWAVAAGGPGGSCGALAGNVTGTCALNSVTGVRAGTLAAIPATCTVGDLYFVNNATAGANVYECTSTNTWTAPSAGGSVFTGSTATTAAFSATPTFSLADVSVKSPVRVEPGVMTANVTAVTFSNKTAGAKFSIVWTEDGTGGRTLTHGASASGTCESTMPTAANSSMEQFYEVSADGSTVTGVGCITNQAYSSSTESSTPPTPAAGVINEGAVTTGANKVFVNPAGTAYAPTHSIVCGTTSVCANTVVVNWQEVLGSAPLVSGTPSTVTITGISPAFTSSATYLCTVSAESAATGALLSVANVSGSSFTVTGPAAVTTVINYRCGGN